jgi:hypothetical protein
MSEKQIATGKTDRQRIPRPQAGALESDGDASSPPLPLASSQSNSFIPSSHTQLRPYSNGDTLNRLKQDPLGKSNIKGVGEVSTSDNTTHRPRAPVKSRRQAATDTKPADYRKQPQMGRKQKSAVLTELWEGLSHFSRNKYVLRNIKS